MDEQFLISTIFRGLRTLDHVELSSNRFYWTDSQHYYRFYRDGYVIRLWVGERGDKPDEYAYNRLLSTPSPKGREKSVFKESICQWEWDIPGKQFFMYTDLGEIGNTQEGLCSIIGNDILMDKRISGFKGRQHHLLRKVDTENFHIRTPKPTIEGKSVYGLYRSLPLIETFYEPKEERSIDTTIFYLLLKENTIPEFYYRVNEAEEPDYALLERWIKNGEQPDNVNSYHHKDFSFSWIKPEKELLIEMVWSELCVFKVFAHFEKEKEEVLAIFLKGELLLKVDFDNLLGMPEYLMMEKIC